MHEFSIIIGRFQPVHNAHKKLIRAALDASKTVIIVLGGDSRARTVKDPWTSSERFEMIKSCFPGEQHRLVFIRAKDYVYNDNLWVTDVQQDIDDIIGESKDVVLVGHKKDATSYYLDMFPQWNFIETGEFERIDATQVREMYFVCNLFGVKELVPPNVFEMMRVSMMKDSIEQRDEFIRLKEEYKHILDYKELWSRAPYPPTFVTVDAVVIKSGHVLVVRRRGHPGKGLIALPGGFINQNESIRDARLRELKEETSIKLTKDELNKCMRDEHVFDHPQRSLRGRTITHAACFDLGVGTLPKVKGDDDADKAWWMPLRDFFQREEEFFEDHFAIISFFVNKF